MKALRVVLIALTALAAQNSSAFTPNCISVVRRTSASSSSVSSHHHFPSLRVPSLLKISAEPMIPMENSISDDQSMREEYDKWREKFNKGSFDPLRFQNFTSNYTALMGANAVAVKRAKELGMQVPSLMSLNEYGDMSLEEYRAVRNGQTAPPPKTQDAPTAIVEPLVIPRATNSFLESKEPGNILNGASDDIKVTTNRAPLVDATVNHSSFNPGSDRIRIAYMDWCKWFEKEPEEERFEVFKSHYTTIEKHCEETGKKMKLNAYADFTPEEYSRLMNLNSPGGVAGATTNGASTKNANKLSDPTFLRNMIIKSQTEEPSSSSSGPHHSTNRGSSGIPTPNADSTTVGTSSVTSPNTPKPGGSYLEALSNQDATKSAPTTPVIPSKVPVWNSGAPAVPAGTSTSNGVAAPPAVQSSYMDAMGTSQKPSGVSESPSAVGSITDSLQGGSSDAATKSSNPGSYMDSYYKSMSASAASSAQPTPSIDVSQPTAIPKPGASSPSSTGDAFKEQSASNMASSSTPSNMDIPSPPPPQLGDSAASMTSSSSDKPSASEPSGPWNSLTTSIGKVKPSFLDSLNNLVGVGSKLDTSAPPKSDTSAPPPKNFQSMEDYANSLKFPSESTQAQTSKTPSSSPLGTETPNAPRDVRRTLRIGEEEARISGARGGVPLKQSSLQQDSARIIPPKAPSADLTEDDDVNFANQAFALAAEARAIAEKEVEAYLNRREAEEKAAEEARAEARKWEEEKSRLAMEAAAASRLRMEEEKAAETARSQARDWNQIRDRMQKEAEEASRKREKELREAQRTIDPKEEEPPKQVLSDWFGGRTPKKEVQKESQPVQPPPVPQAEQKKSSIFGMFQGEDKLSQESTPQIEIPKPTQKQKPGKDWISALFDFFGVEDYDEDEDIEQMPGRGTVRIIQEPKKKSVFDFFVREDSLYERSEIGRGTIRIEDNPKPSFFSFFARARTSQPRTSLPLDSSTNSTKKPSFFSFLGGDPGSFFFGSFTDTKNAVPTLSTWTQNFDGTITGYISNSKRPEYPNGAKITTSPVKKGAKPMTLVTTMSGTKYRLGQSSVKEGIKNTPVPTGTGSLFNTSPFSNKAQDEIPILSRWKQNPDGTLTGSVSNSIDFENGALITTSPVKEGAKRGTVVTTRGGSRYRLQ